MPLTLLNRHFTRFDLLPKEKAGAPLLLACDQEDLANLCTVTCKARRLGCLAILVDHIAFDLGGHF